MNHKNMCLNYYEHNIIIILFILQSNINVYDIQTASADITTHVCMIDIFLYNIFFPQIRWAGVKNINRTLRHNERVRIGQRDHWIATPTRNGDSTKIPSVYHTRIIRYCIISCVALPVAIQRPALWWRWIMGRSQP